MEKIKEWFLACRGYSLPMSFLCFLIAFSYAIEQHGNILYGILAFFGVALVHLGVNLYDDYIDTIFKTPKQECKTQYLDKKIFTLKHVLIGFIAYFLIASLIGGFFLFKVGYEILYVVIPTVIISLLYPRLSHKMPAEFLIALIFGPLMFEGIYFVMKQGFSLNLFLISIPCGLLVGMVGMVHSYMDLDFDKVTGKKTYPMLFKTKENALNGIIAIIILAYVLIVTLSLSQILSYISLLSLGSIYFLSKLKDELKNYDASDKNSFLKIFMLSQKIFIFTSCAITLGILG